MAGLTSTKSPKDTVAEQAQQSLQEPAPQPMRSGPYVDILSLQCTAGNRAVTGLLGSGNEPTATNGVPLIVTEVLRSPGQPLDPDTRASMEQRFGRDFSQVSI